MEDAPQAGSNLVRAEQALAEQRHLEERVLRKERKGAIQAALVEGPAVGVQMFAKFHRGVSPSSPAEPAEFPENGSPLQGCQWTLWDQRVSVNKKFTKLRNSSRSVVMSSLLYILFL